jgi:ABC-2 type transport system ATP-binding protein
MTVNDYLAYVARLKGVESERVATLVSRAIDKTSLGEVRPRLIQNLSKGFRQRVGIAQALVSDPEVLILDEPTVGLDPKQVAEIRNLIKELAGHHTIVLSTHILPEVQATCQRIIIINRGQIVAEDTLEGLGKRMSGGRRMLIKMRRPSGSVQQGLSGLQGVIAVHAQKDPALFEVDIQEGDDMIERLAAFVVAQNAGLLEMRTVSVNLEDIFIKLTSNEQQLGGLT